MNLVPEPSAKKKFCCSPKVTSAGSSTPNATIALPGLPSECPVPGVDAARMVEPLLASQRSVVDGGMTWLADAN